MVRPKARKSLKNIQGLVLKKIIGQIVSYMMSTFSIKTLSPWKKCLDEKGHILPHIIESYNSAFW